VKLRWTGRARDDLVAIGLHIARDNPTAARRWVARGWGSHPEQLAGDRVLLDGEYVTKT